MKSLYWRIYLTVVLVLAAFALGAVWLFQQQIEQERGSAEVAASERLQAMAVLIHRALPPATAPQDEQALALSAWGQKLRMAIALDDGHGRRIAASDIFERREDDLGARLIPIELEDGRRLIFLRPPRPAMPRLDGLPQAGPGPRFEGREPQGRRPDGPPAWPLLGHLWSGQTLAVLLLLLFVGVAAGAYPVVRRLTRRLEALKQGVEQFGQGQLGHRVDATGTDEVAALARSFNRSAEQVETLLQSHKSLLANASHELRSPLARLKMAFAMLDGASEVQQARLAREIDTNIRELDALVEEVLLASRLEADGQSLNRQPVDLLALMNEEAGRIEARVEFDRAQGADCTLMADDRLLRRALRNLLENARRYGGDDVLLQLTRQADRIELRVCDRGPGVPEAMRERIFEAFFRLPGHAEQAGGVGLGLSLVRQIAQRHGGRVRCEAREGGGSVFVLSLPRI